MTADRLFGVDRKKRWTGSRALVVLEPGVCPVDGSHLEDAAVTEMALLRHGGYGADRTSSTQWCPACGWSIERAVTETNPRRRGRP